MRLHGINVPQGGAPDRTLATQGALPTRPGGSRQIREGHSAPIQGTGNQSDLVGSKSTGTMTWKPQGPWNTQYPRARGPRPSQHGSPGRPWCSASCCVLPAPMLLPSHRHSTDVQPPRKPLPGTGKLHPGGTLGSVWGRLWSSHWGAPRIEGVRPGRLPSPRGPPRALENDGPLSAVPRVWRGTCTSPSGV